VCVCVYAGICVSGVCVYGNENDTE